VPHFPRFSFPFLVLVGHDDTRTRCLARNRLIALSAASSNDFQSVWASFDCSDHQRCQPPSKAVPDELIDALGLRQAAELITNVTADAPENVFLPGGACPRAGDFLLCHLGAAPGFSRLIAH
jgi:hypothetical protein